MRILLIGEFSRLHNSLKEGLENLGHEVLLIGTGDGFKKYPVDINIDNLFFKNNITNILKLAFYKLFRIDLAAIERGLLFWFHLKKLKCYDVVQLINETAIKTTPFFETFLIKKIVKHNNKLFLLSSGIDSMNIKFCLQGGMKYSVFTPYLENNKNPFYSKVYIHSFRYLKKNYRKLNDYLMQNVNGIIASDMDYHVPLKSNNNYLGMIPNPINTNKIKYIPININSKIKIFHGINMGSQIHKGNEYFTKALAIIKNKYSEKIETIETTSLPYNEYIEKYNDCHILLDQVYGYDQGYNALEAMAKGKVVFTGAEQEFLDYYGLNKNEVCINALPNVDSIVKELEYLILNPKKIEEISKNARKFIEKEHDYVKIAQKYINNWESN